MRECTKCLKILPDKSFHSRADGRNGGLFSLCKVCENTRNRIRYASNREAERARHKKKNIALKALVLDHYGSECSCCGIADEVFLAIDHVDGGGSAHRREVSRSHGSFYYWLKKNGFPEGFQTLCHNCNWAKSHGGCPHMVRSFS